MAYELPHYEDADLYDPADPARVDAVGRFTAQDYTLCHALGFANNHEVDTHLSRRLAEVDLDLAGSVEFNSEAGCFFAHTTSIEAMERFAAFVAAEVAAGPNPDAQPGDITSSPAYFEWPR